MSTAPLDPHTRAFALAQPGAIDRGDRIKFQCPACLAEGHDAHQDNAVLFADGRVGCAVGGRLHGPAIRQALGAIRDKRSPTESGGERSLEIINASTITPTHTEWLWPGRLAVGELTNCVGLPDQGKSLVCLDVAARLSIGSPMPPARRRPGAGTPRRVLILADEDSVSSTHVPRLLKAGADLDQIDFVKMVRDAQGRPSMLTLDKDLDLLERLTRERSYGVVILDGLASYLGDAKTHNDAAVRQVLMPFREWLQRCGVAGLATMHPPKETKNLAYLAGGSVAFTAIPRVALGVVADPDDDRDPPRRVLFKLKGNIYGPVPFLAYTIVAEGPKDIPSLEWDPNPVITNVAALLRPPRRAEGETRTEACREWLRSLLAPGPMFQTDIEKAARAQGFSDSLLYSARQGIVHPSKQGRFQGKWLWTLTPTAAPPVQPDAVTLQRGAAAQPDTDTPRREELSSADEAASVTGLDPDLLVELDLAWARQREAINFALSIFKAHVVKVLPRDNEYPE